MAPLVVYLMSTRCASASPWNHRDHLRTRVAPAAAAYAARLEHPIVAVVDECDGEELPVCERCAPSPLAPSLPPSIVWVSDHTPPELRVTYCSFLKLTSP